jgi:NADPH2:quinone reductase
MTQAAQHTMHAAAIDEFGGPITPHTLPVPEVGADEILIHVESAGVGVWDPFEAEGGFAAMYGGARAKFPYVLGTDGAGTVEDVGQDVRGFKKGDRVYAMALMNKKGGFYAEYAAVKAKDASKIPGNLSVEQAGVLPVDAITALRGLDELNLKAGESVLIFGASGGIGHLAVQLAKRMGARVLAVASGNDGVELVKRLGADAVIDGHKEDVQAAARKFAPGGLDAVLLTAGGKEAERALEALRDGGRVAYPNGVEPEPKARPGIKVTSYNGEASPEEIAKLNSLIEKGPFEVHVARTFPLEKAEEAHKALNQHYLGKIALRPS